LGEQFEKLIQQPLENIHGGPHGSSKTVVAVMDALDECNREQDISVIISSPIEGEIPEISLFKGFCNQQARAPNSGLLQGTSWY
jgi:hypothetical protein